MGCGASRPDCDDEGPITPRNGTWTKYSNIDMCDQGDVQIIRGWRSKRSIAEMKRIVEQNNWSAICVGSFGHAALKTFDFQLRQHHCKPSKGYTCTIFVFTPPSHKVKPEGGPKPKLVLVSTNDPRRITLANAAAVSAGQQAPLTLASHPGYAICREYLGRGTAFDEWDYTALAVGPAARAVTCALVGQQLVEGLTQGVITPSEFKFHLENHFDFVWHNRIHPARLHEEARKHAHRPLDVRIDPSSGAIMPATRGDLCYGLEFAELPPLGLVAKPRLVLVGTNDPRRITLANAAAVSAGQQAPLTLASHPGYAICRDFPERRTAFDEWDYTALAVGPAAQAVTCALVDRKLVEGLTQGVITPSMLNFHYENPLDFVWHKRNHPARLHKEARKRFHRPLDVRIDPSSGAIMLATRGDLCYGLEFHELPPQKGSLEARGD